MPSEVATAFRRPSAAVGAEGSEEAAGVKREKREAIEEQREEERKEEREEEREGEEERARGAARGEGAVAEGEGEVGREGR